MNLHIKQLIEEGEGPQLDFKFEINDSRKIARTLVAFANTFGGRLLIGVKDNGRIAGIRSDEEYYMLESSAHLYCRPPVSFKAKQWEIDGKTILEVSISRSSELPHFARSENNKWLAYIRVHDQNILANTVLLKVWKRNSRKYGTFLTYRENERWLLNYLSEHQDISLNQFCRHTGLSRHRAEIILVNLIIMDVIRMDYRDHHFVFLLTEKEEPTT
jgi:hypothetical protein